jgi:hypothetical protein
MCAYNPIICITIVIVVPKTVYSTGNFRDAQRSVLDKLLELDEVVKTGSNKL